MNQNGLEFLVKSFPWVVSRIYVPMVKEYIRYNSKKYFNESLFNINSCALSRL
ncbi:hypothetical protein SAMN04488023_1607 [Pedobacter rhizosphaerae]|uniref:Uncharacterized protein n=1 Tax=Pedobacter rhizosphaerae TaxID=390241 RepID=A0A1H9W781_9SPHI|nr:hypothetical protein SAMN04488023_1607 [Pedobacter rhizosphaerae]